MTLHEFFANHPWIAWSLVAFVAAEFVAVVVLIVRLLKKPRQTTKH